LINIFIQLMSGKCALCHERDQKDNLIAEIGEWFLNFNRYPYVPGHLLLLPKTEVPTLNECDEKTKQELGNILGTIQDVLMECTFRTSCNIGINTGEQSGASIPEHLHIHLVPRRENDFNFMLTCSETDENGTRIPKEFVQFFHHYGKIRNMIIGAFVDNVDNRLIKLTGYVQNKDVKRAASEDLD
jgi:ATP adenylyltransferase